MRSVRVLLIIFAVVLMASCQKRSVFKEEKSVIHYKVLQEYYSEFRESSGGGVIRQYLLNQLRKRDAVIDVVEFERKSENFSEEKGANIICRFYPQMSRRIMLVGLYSPWALTESGEYEKESAKMSFNLALMLETARMIAAEPPNQYGVDLVFLDCLLLEEGRLTPAIDIFTEKFTKKKPEAAIFFRLENTEELTIPIDNYSYQQVPHVVYRVWRKAQLLGRTEYEQRLKVNPALMNEEKLYDEFYLIKLENEVQPDEVPDSEALRNNFRKIGSLTREMIYDKD